ncbi:hypothetical protein [Christensenella tenuis]|jgi:hypothetical protein|uniref:Yip1 domain-containing protein n=1 Tax=Christensenella tenuis TaxID=2763033 RepID=A0ABR7EGP5_9FIRM|nr:hypothetical protein [Christensenella tenuis]MBC5648561.1 hypothetical protein [Christensenella tenuis]
MEHSRARQIWWISLVATVVLVAVYMGFFLAMLDSYDIVLGMVSMLSAVAAACTAVIATISFIRYRKMRGIEKIKPICIALLAVWVTTPAFITLLPIPGTEHIAGAAGLLVLITLGIWIGVIALSILYLIRSRGKETAKYPIVICLLLVAAGILAVLITV